MGKIKKEILILSTHHDDSSTKVMRWLSHLNREIEIIRLSPEDLLEGIVTINCEESSFSITLSTGKTLHSECIGAVWTRKWCINNITLELNTTTLNKHKELIKQNLQREYDVLFEYIIYLLECNPNIFWLNKPQYMRPNKLIQLKIASRSGLLIPETFVTNDVSHIQLKNFITKPMGDCFTYDYKGNYFTNYTAEVSSFSQSSSLMVSCIQKKIEKMSEIRVFYLTEHCFSLMIHSQTNKNTSTDYRRYDFQNPIRYEPCRLPKKLVNGIKLFMRKMNLQTGSLDFILTPEGQYIFLEVNPCGQYDIFNLCNIHPDRMIAEILITNSNTH